MNEQRYTDKNALKEGKQDQYEPTNNTQYDWRRTKYCRYT